MMTSTSHRVVTTRGGVIENTHICHAAVVSADGTLLYSLGDPHRVTLLRSAAKPAQTLAILESGCQSWAGFSEADLALMTSSHNAEDRHIDRARNMLVKAAAKESDLVCGGEASISNSVNRIWHQRNLTPTSLHNNCSGKHAGMLAGAKTLGGDSSEYHHPEHPMQQKVRAVVAAMSCAPEEVTSWGIDGCNLPAPAFPLLYTARMYANFASCADSVEQHVQQGGSATLAGRSELAARVFSAMTSYPEMVAGEGRFDTALMQAFKGDLIGKVGADGCYGIGLRARATERKQALGIAVKIEDGNLSILYAVAAEILHQLGIGTAEQRGALDDFHKLARRNTAGVTVGETKFDFRLQEEGTQA